ncbi:ABC transporter permease [Rhodococcus sp. A14]|uniref:ABC transporter permease subunit n=1 Tax=Rhodococcus sp. A14 TaxID=1194106 RepID=UPI0014227D3C|nr:ABC transporter permease [Rhodococcus sp. A14]
MPDRPFRRSGGLTLWLGVAFLAVIGGYALLVPWLAGVDDRLTDFSAARQAPSWSHPFGTDIAGRDLFVRVAAGLRISLLIAAICALASAALGAAVGVVTAAVGGWADRLAMRTVDGINAMPHLLLGIVIVALYPGNLAAIIASIALTHWTQVARIARAEVLTVRGSAFVDAAYLAGATRAQVMRTHLMPAAAGQTVIAVILLLPHAIWHESTLSFLGLGLSPDRPSLGTLLQEARSSLLLGGWWTLTFPALLLLLTTLAVAGIGAAVRDRISPPIMERSPR